ncbi:hypothetical protein OWR28_06455 [Chryseobacterium sp. 1B4]
MKPGSIPLKRRKNSFPECGKESKADGSESEKFLSVATEPCSASFLSLLIFLFIIYRKNKNLSEQKEINLQQKIEDIKQKKSSRLPKQFLMVKKGKENVLQGIFTMAWAACWPV